jgi:hypothetical protein
MTVSAISAKYYELLIKLYKNINNNHIKWTQALNANYFAAELNFRFKIRIYKTIGNLATKYIFKMFDDGGIKVFEISTDKNGHDEVNIDGEKVTINQILEEIYEWARAYSMDIIDKVDKAGEILDDLARENEKKKSGTTIIRP